MKPEDPQPPAREGRKERLRAALRANLRKRHGQRQALRAARPPGKESPQEPRGGD